MNDRIDEDKPIILSNSEPQLEYTTSKSQTSQVSKTANITNTTC